jgi:hypothetical protein
MKTETGVAIFGYAIGLPAALYLSETMGAGFTFALLFLLWGNNCVQRKG